MFYSPGLFINYSAAYLAMIAYRVENGRDWVVIKKTVVDIGKTYYRVFEGDFNIAKKDGWEVITNDITPVKLRMCSTFEDYAEYCRSSLTKGK